MIILDENDIVNAIEIKDILRVIEKAFLIQENGNFTMPDRLHISKKQNAFLVMPCISGNSFSTKLVSVCPDNRSKGLPSIYGSVILSDSTTGKPLALINGSKLTVLRTAAVGALGVIYTTPNDIISLGLIGAGVQGYNQVLFSCFARNIQQVNIFDPYNSKLQEFANELKKELPEVDVRTSKNVRDTVLNSELIICATTSNRPVIPEDEKILTGKHFIGIGSYKPDMQEFPDSLFPLLDQVFVDTEFAVKETGDLVNPLLNNWIKQDQIYSLGKLVEKKVSLSSNETTLFKSVGMALFDLVVAELVYTKAKQKNLGITVNF